MRINRTGERPSDPITDRQRPKGPAATGAESAKTRTSAPAAREGAGLRVVRDAAAETAVAAVVSTEAQAAGASRERVDSEVLERLASVKAAIAGGTYAVDFDKLANRLVDEELARGGGR